ncbi:two-component system sensor histidine kinase NtrB [Geopsychrobacter electrodiphilus]|uniref:two-component system sensor histidine kinase NtrB n=1 Tax=Geopsychrobacter electrodiphilus TaxID=225196 RepID=UPI000382A243|nr:ATP-binding protein [Geopsychrobacter electrodiphilus]
MTENSFFGSNGPLNRLIRFLLGLSIPRVAGLFMVIAVVVAIIIVEGIDFLWDGRFSAELLCAAVVTAILDGMLVVGLLAALLSELHKEVERRQIAENASDTLNAELEIKVRERTRQLLEVQEELLRKEKLALLGQVADTVGHELRNPLGVMNNAVYFLQTVLSDADETTKEYLGIIKDEIADADRIVSDLLDAVRTKPPHPQLVEVAELIEQTLRRCEVPPAVTVRLDIPDALPALRVDPGQIHQVVWNLLTNAVEAMPDGGNMEISAVADPQAKTVTVSITDSGDGITPEHRARLFQPMFTTKARRVGLGLVVVKNLTQANGGSVGMESEPGAGSRFFVTLPGG